MKHFDFKILINKDAKKARLWCREHFGELEIKHLTVKCRQWNKGRTKLIRTYTKNIGTVYDVEKNAWYNKVGGDANPRAFYFKHIIDAMAFKLRWI